MTAARTAIPGSGVVHTSRRRPSIVYGARLGLARARLWMRIARLALRAYGSPAHAWSAVAQLAAARRRANRWTAQKYVLAGGRHFFSMYAPGFPSPVFDEFIERELNRMQPFRDSPTGFQNVIIAMTRRCPLRCDHCCEWDVLNEAEALSLDQLKEIVRRMQADGVSQVFFSGGEPLQRFSDLLELVEMASRASDVWILSSGCGLTPERAARLRRAGLTGISLSLDHWDGSQHDRLRGRAGVFDAVTRAAAVAGEHELLVALSLCPRREFVEDPHLDRYLGVAKTLGAGFIQLLEPKAVGHYAGQDVALSRQQQMTLEAFADRLNRDPACRHLPGVEYLDYISRTLGCVGAGNRTMYVDTSGVLHPCPFCRSGASRVLDGALRAQLTALRSGGCHAMRAT